MARFKNRDILVLQNEEVLFGDAQEASIKYDGSNLLVNQLLEHTVDGPYATREWVNETFAGLEWQNSVLSKVTDIPGGPSVEDRYIIPAGATGAWSGLDDSIAEYNVTWVYTTPSAGFASYVEDEGIYYIYNGSSWIKLGGVVSHSALLNLDVDDHTHYLLADGSRAADNLTVTSTITAAEIQVWQGAEDDEAILFRSTDVAHGITTIAETEVYGHLAKADADAGGVGLWGFSESTIGSSIYSYYGDAQGDTDKDTTALGAITLYALQASGTGVQDVGATDNIFVLRPRRSGGLSSSLIADGSGNLYIDGDYRSFGTTLDVLTSNNYGMSIAADGTITFSGSVSGEDHGLLVGLADDDHIQYYHTDGRRSWSGALTVESAESKIEFLEDTATIGVVSNTDLMSLAPTAVTIDGDLYCDTLHSDAASVIIGSVTMSDVGGVLTVDAVISSPSGSGGSDYATLDYVDAEFLTKSDTGHDHDDAYYTKALAGSTFSPIASGVTGGDGHDHTGGAGAQIDHTGLANKGTNTHSQIDDHIDNVSVDHSSFITSAGVTYENLDAAGDVGTSAGQVAIGDHSHGVADGVWILLNKDTLSNSASAGSINLTGYSKLMVIWENLIPANDAVDLNLTVSDDNGASWESSQYYGYMGGSTHVGGAFSETMANNSVFHITDPTYGVGSDAGEDGANGWLILYGFNTSKKTFLDGRTTWWDGDGNLYTAWFGYMYNVQAVLNGLKFAYSAGNIETGTLTIYGIADS